MAIKFTLKYAGKDDGHFFSHSKTVLLIDGILFHEYLPHKQLVECLKMASQKFHDDIEEAAEHMRNYKLGVFVWLYTSDVYRGEELSGSFRMQYFMAIIGYLCQQKPVESIELHLPLNAFFINQLKKFGIRIKHKRKNYFRFLLAQHIYGFLKFTRSIFNDLKYVLAAPNPKFNGTLIGVTANIKHHRYDDLKKICSLYENYSFFSQNQSEVLDSEGEHVVEFRRETNLFDFFSSGFHVLRFWFFLLANKKLIPEALYRHHTGLYNLMMFYHVFLTLKGIRKYLNKCTIDTILQISTLTTPIHRMLMSEAKRHGAKFILISSRTYGPYERSDVLLTPDVRGYNQTALPDQIIVRDNYSAGIVIQRFPELSPKVRVAGRLLSRLDTDHRFDSDKPTALLLLFDHYDDLAEGLIREVKKSGVDKMVTTIIFKCHHLLIMHEDEIRKYFPQNEIIDITGRDYDQIEKFKTIAISVATTAAMEAIQFGAVLIWAPYLWDGAILVDDAMRNIGVLSENNEDLRRNAQKLINNNELYFSQYLKTKHYCDTHFNTTELISSQLEKIRNMHK